MKRLFIILMVVSLTGVACKKWLGSNIDTATPQKSPAHIMLMPMFAQMERGIAGDARYVGRYIQNWGLNSSLDAIERHGYLRNSDAMGEIWRTVYFGVGKNIDLMLADAIPNQKWEFVGAGQAIRAWGFQTASDYHGDIIVKQAFEPNRSIFDYDSQDIAYAEAKRLCEEAISNFTRTDGKLGSASLFPTADLVYKGDVVKWRKFCFGILARMANNISNKTSYNPDEVISYVDKALAANADNFAVPNGISSDASNNYGPAKIPSVYPSLSGSYLQSNMIAQLMNGSALGATDPRAPIMLTASPDGQYRGVKPGQGDLNRNASSSIINPTEIPNVYGLKSAVTPPVGSGKFIFKDDVVFTVMSYAEMQFIKAEAAFRKGSKTIAYSAFKAGISAHMDWVGVSAANKASYLASAAVPQTENLLTLKDIMLQKYIAMWGVGVLETWSDMRRYKYDTTIYSRYTLLPDVTYTSGTLFEDNSGKLAYRVRPRYNSEYVWNFESLKKIGADQLNYHTKEPWFILP